MDYQAMEVGDKQFIANGKWSASCEAKKLYDQVSEYAAKTGAQYQIEMEPKNGGHDMFLVRIR